MSNNANEVIMGKLNQEIQNLKNQAEFDKVKIAVITQSLSEVMNFNSELKTGNVLMQQQIQKLNEDIQILKNKVNESEEKMKLAE
jgi:hypothetical protein